MRENWLKVSLYKDLNYVKTGMTKFDGSKEYYSTGSIKGKKYTPEGLFEYLEKPSRANRIVKTFDVLQARMKDTNKVIMINSQLNEQLFSTGFFQVRTHNIDLSKFMYYYFNSSKFLNEKDSYCTGSTQSAINDNSIKKIYLPLPPLLEQKAIVSKLEQLFSELDNGIENLKIAQQKIKVFRNTILIEAFKIKKNKKQTILSEVMEKIQIGPFGTQLHKEEYIENGIPLINPMHIKNGKILPNISYSITIDKRNSLPNYILQCGDVIMGRRGEMGRCGLVTDKEEGWFCGTGSIYFRPNNQKINSVYLYNYLKSPIVKKYLTGNATGTTMANLNKKIVSNLPINNISVKEQIQIVQDIESKLSVCDNIETTISNVLQKSEALRQSILKKAFKGKLLTIKELEGIKNHPEYESAEKLLERIKQERDK